MDWAQGLLVFGEMGNRLFWSINLVKIDGPVQPIATLNRTGNPGDLVDEACRGGKFTDLLMEGCFA